MEFLNLLASARTPFLTKLAEIVTMLGEETVLVVLGMMIMWCVNKKQGARLVLIAMTSLAINSLLKAIFVVPRPWILQPGIAVEAAIPAASDYSFPSGHTQNATVIFCFLAALTGKKRMWIPALLISVLVGFSRMFLGVHTPLDVSVGFLTGLLCTVIMRRVFQWADDDPQKNRRINLVCLLIALVTVCWVAFGPKGAGHDPVFDEEGLKNTCTILAVLAATLISVQIDRRWVRYPEQAVWWVNVLKLGIGLALFMCIRTLLKSILPANPVWDGIRYFITVILMLGFWPLSFEPLSRLSARRS